MRIGNGVSIRIPGDWADCWLHKDILYLWGDDGASFHLPVSEILREIRLSYSSEVAMVIEYAIFRNDWISSDQHRNLLRSEGFARLWATAVEEVLLSGPIQYSPSSLRPLRIETIPGILLGSSIFANRLFLATTEGLFESWIGPEYVGGSLNLIPTMPGLEFRDVNANFAAVTASAADEGLWFGEVDRKISSSHVSLRTRTSLRQVADSSLRASFAARDVLNYTGAAAPTIWQTKTRQDREVGDQYLSWKIEDIDSSYSLDSDIRRASESSDNRTKVHGENIQVLGNSNKNLLVARRENLQAFNIEKHSSRFEIEQSKSYKKEISLPVNHQDVLSTHGISGGFVVEQPNLVTLVNEKGAIPLLEGEFAQIRTFPGSRKYSSVCAAIDNVSCILTGTKYLL